MASFFRRLVKGKERQIEDECDVGRFARAFQEILVGCVSFQVLLKTQASFNGAHNTGLSPSELLKRLQLLLNALVVEENEARAFKGTAGNCFEYLLDNNVVGALVDIILDAKTSTDQGKLVIEWLTDVIGAMEATFLIHSATHSPIIKLLNCLRSQQDFGENYELEIVQLMCAICGKLRSYPDLLIIFSRPAIQTTSSRVTSPTPSSNHSTSSNSTFKRADFLLFDYLLTFVHREGHLGQLSQAALLLLIQVAMAAHTTNKFPPAQRTPDNVILLPSASQSPAAKARLQDIALQLAEWLLDSDFAEVLAAGLGALYGLLPSKLATAPFSISRIQSSDMKLTEDDSQTSDSRSRALGMAKLQEPSTLLAISSFTRFVQFIQAVMSKSSHASHGDREKELMAGALREALVTAIDAIFLSSVIYPSMPESAIDDGSSLAVLVYLKQFVDALEPESPLLEASLGHLLASSNLSYEERQRQPSVQPNGSPVSTKIKKRKSAAFLLVESAQLSTHLDSHLFAEEERFNLRDLLLDNLESDCIQSDNASASGTAVHGLLVSLSVQNPTMLLDIFQTTSTLRTDSLLSQKHRHSASNWSANCDQFTYSGSHEAWTKEAKIGPAGRMLAAREFLESIRTIGTLESPAKSQIDMDESVRCAISSISSQSSFWNTLPKVQSQSRRLSTIPPTSRLLKVMLKHLNNFFLNSAEYNLSLAATFLTMASLPQLGLVGWALDGDFLLGGVHPRNVCGILTQLQHLLQTLPLQIPTLAQHLATRKASLSVVQDLADAINDTRPMTNPTKTNTRSQKSHVDPYSDHFDNTSRQMVEIPLFEDASPDRVRGVSSNPSVWSDFSKERVSRKVPTAELTSLHNLLDNIIILEDLGQQLAALIQVRIVSGID